MGSLVVCMVLMCVVNIVLRLCRWYVCLISEKLVLVGWCVVSVVGICVVWVVSWVGMWVSVVMMLVNGSCCGCVVNIVL